MDCISPVDTGFLGVVRLRLDTRSLPFLLKADFLAILAISVSKGPSTCASNVMYWLRVGSSQWSLLRCFTQLCQNSQYVGAI